MAERHGVSLSSVRTHARVEGWRRSDQPLAPPPPRDDPLTDEDEELHPVDLAELARRQAARAILRGRASDAERWTRLAERWDKLTVTRDQIQPAELDGLMRLARAAAVVSRQDFASASRIRAELRREVHEVFGSPDGPPLHGLHGLHGAERVDQTAAPAAMAAPPSPLATRDPSD